MVETIMALFIGSLLIAGASILYLRNLDDSQTNVGLQQTIVMQKSVRELYAGQPDFAGLNNTVMDNSGFVPNDLRTGVIGQLRNTWGGAINVAVNGGDPQHFDLSFANVPPEACTRLVAYTGNQRGTTDGMAQITVNANGGDTIFNTFPTSVAAVVPACADANAQATITWELY